MWNVVSLNISLPKGRVGLLQNKLTGMQVKEDGKSKCPTVMAGIKVYTLLRKQADFHLVLCYEKIVVRFKFEKANESKQSMCT